MPLKAGQWYCNAKVKGSVLGRTSTGKEQLAVTFETTDPKNPSVTKYLFFTDKAMEMTCKALVALGWKPEEHDFDINLLNETDAIVGRECSLVLENEVVPEEYGGGSRVTVVFVNEKGGAVKDRMSADDASAFSNTLRSRLRSARIAQDPKSASAKAKPATEDPTTKHGPACACTIKVRACEAPGCEGAPF